MLRDTRYGCRPARFRAATPTFSQFSPRVTRSRNVSSRREIHRRGGRGAAKKQKLRAIPNYLFFFFSLSQNRHTFADSSIADGTTRELTEGKVSKLKSREFVRSARLNLAVTFEPDTVQTRIPSAGFEFSCPPLSPHLPILPILPTRATRGSNDVDDVAVEIAMKTRWEGEGGGGRGEGGGVAAPAVKNAGAQSGLNASSNSAGHWQVFARCAAVHFNVLNA